MSEHSPKIERYCQASLGVVIHWPIASGVITIEIAKTPKLLLLVGLLLFMAMLLSPVQAADETRAIRTQMATAIVYRMAASNFEKNIDPFDETMAKVLRSEM